MEIRIRLSRATEETEEQRQALIHALESLDLTFAGYSIDMLQIKSGAPGAPFVVDHKSRKAYAGLENYRPGDPHHHEERLPAYPADGLEFIGYDEREREAEDSGAFTFKPSEGPEPRTWSGIKITAGADLPAVVDVEGHGRWTLDGQLYGKPGHPHLVLLTTLRGMGSVTEVLGEPVPDAFEHKGRRIFTMCPSCNSDMPRLRTFANDGSGPCSDSWHDPETTVL